mgnify:FL=1
MKYNTKKELKNTKELYNIYTILWQYSKDGSEMNPFIINKDRTKIKNILTNEVFEYSTFDARKDLLDTSLMASIVALNLNMARDYRIYTHPAELYPIGFKIKVPKNYIERLKKSFQSHLIKAHKLQSKNKIKQNKIEERVEKSRDF